MKDDKDIKDLIQKVSYNNRDIETNRGYAWYYYFSYWTLAFFLFHKANLIPYSPYLIYFCIVIFIAIEMIYLIVYQIYFRITDPSNQNIIQDKEAWSIIGAWLILLQIVFEVYCVHHFLRNGAQLSVSFPLTFTVCKLYRKA